MSHDIEEVAATVLYEGYMLFPYTRSTTKNQQRWTFGGVYPRAWSESSPGDDPWVMQTQCLIIGDARTEVQATLRFLQVIDRVVEDRRGATPRLVEELQVGDFVYRPWDEAIERSFPIGPLRLGDGAASGQTRPIDIGEGSEEEPLRDAEGNALGVLLRRRQAIRGEVEVSAVPLTPGCFRLTVRIANLTPWSAKGDGAQSRSAVLRHTLVSTHTILRVQDGEFVSLLEPPEEYADAAAACENVKTWPVLAGEEGQRSAMLSSPIILYDYPAISPESHGDFFDSTEIDELLALTVLTLTDDEKREMRESDPRSREILERTEGLTPEQFMSLHGTIRSMQVLRDGES